MNKLSYIYAYCHPAEALSIYETNFGEFNPKKLDKTAFDWSNVGNATGKFFQQLGTNPNYQRIALGLGGAALGGIAGGWKKGWRGALLGAGLGGLGGYYAPTAWDYMKGKSGTPTAGTPAAPSASPIPAPASVVPGSQPVLNVPAAPLPSQHTSVGAPGTASSFDPSKESLFSYRMRMAKDPTAGRVGEVNRFGAEPLPPRMAAGQYGSNPSLPSWGGAVRPQERVAALNAAAIPAGTQGVTQFGAGTPIVGGAVHPSPQDRIQQLRAQYLQNMNSLPNPQAQIQQLRAQYLQNMNNFTG